MRTKHLNKAKIVKDDEFYTLYSDVKEELDLYLPTNTDSNLSGKTVYCNCDSEDSNFVKYFIDTFDEHNLKGLYFSSYTPNESEQSYVYEFDGYDLIEHKVEGDNSFDSEYLDWIYDNTDVVITNPPFSKLSPFVEHLLAKDKDFIILASNLFWTRSNMGQYFIDEVLNFGNHAGCSLNFIRPNGSMKKVAVSWITKGFDIKPKSHPFHKGYLEPTVNSIKRDIPMTDTIKGLKLRDDRYYYMPISIQQYLSSEDFKVLGLLTNDTNKTHPKAEPIIIKDTWQIHNDKGCCTYIGDKQIKTCIIETESDAYGQVFYSNELGHFFKASFTRVLIKTDFTNKN